MSTASSLTSTLKNATKCQYLSQKKCNPPVTHKTYNLQASFSWAHCAICTGGHKKLARLLGQGKFSYLTVLGLVWRRVGKSGGTRNKSRFLWENSNIPIPEITEDPIFKQLPCSLNMELSTFVPLIMNFERLDTSLLFFPPASAMEGIKLSDVCVCLLVSALTDDPFDIQTQNTGKGWPWQHLEWIWRSRSQVMVGRLKNRIFLCSN